MAERATMHRGKPGFDLWQGTIPPTMSPLVLEIPDDTLLSLKLTGEDAAAAIRLAASVKLYELGRLSSGAAARLAGVPRVVFLSKLADYGVDTFRLTTNELERQAPLV